MAHAEFDEVFGIGHPSASGRPAGQGACPRFDDGDAAPPQDFDVFLSGGIFVHVRVHGGRHDDGTAHGEQGGGEFVVGNAVGEFGHEIGGTRGNEGKIGLSAEGDVTLREIVGIFEGIGVTFGMGDALKGRRTDEFLGVGGQDDVNVRPQLSEFTGDARRFERGDASGDAEEDIFVFEHGEHGRNSG